jgi:hypothetical protein
MNDEQYLVHCSELLAEFSKTLSQRTEGLEQDDGLRVLAEEFQRLVQDSSADTYSQGGSLVDRLFTTHPDFAPTFPRELLWFFGGDCLHFMPDDEIAVYQRLDDQRGQAAQRGEIFDLRSARSKLLKLQ